MAHGEEKSIINTNYDGARLLFSCVYQILENRLSVQRWLFPYRSKEKGRKNKKELSNPFRSETMVLFLFFISLFTPLTVPNMKYATSTPPDFKQISV